MNRTEVDLELVARQLKSASAAALMLTAVLVLANPLPASASNYGIELNGVYRVTSNGDWAKTNDVFIDEQTVVQNWTISSSCQDPVDCTGHVSSDQGWTAPINFVNDRWVMKRSIPAWEPCPDGTSAAGNQQFVFWGTTQMGTSSATNTELLTGWDRTTGQSGACGVNKPLVIRFPLRLDKLPV